MGLPPEFLGEYVPMIQQGHAAAGARRWRKKYFAPEKQSIVVVGDPSKLDAQLAPYGEFTVTDK